MNMNVTSLSSLGLVTALTACGLQLGPQDSDQGKDSAKASSPLLGTWEACAPVEDAYLLQTRTFTPDGKIVSKMRAAKDEACKEVQSEEELAQEKEAFKSALMTSMGQTEEEATQAADKLFGLYDSEGTYKEGDALDQGAVALDVTEDEKTVYISYKVDGDKLYLSDTCDQDDVEEGTCSKEHGDRPDNRSTNLSVKLVKSKR